MNNGIQHAIKNIGRKVLNLNNITFNKRFGSMIGRCFELPYVSYCQPLAVTLKRQTVQKNMTTERKKNYICQIMSRQTYVNNLW